MLMNRCLYYCFIILFVLLFVNLAFASQYQKSGTLGESQMSEDEGWVPTVLKSNVPGIENQGLRAYNEMTKCFSIIIGLIILIIFFVILCTISNNTRVIKALLLGILEELRSAKSK